MGPGVPVPQELGDPEVLGLTMLPTARGHQNRLNSPASLISWFIGATCLFYRASEEMGTQQVTRNFRVMSTWTPVGSTLPLQLQPPGTSQGQRSHTDTSQQHLRYPTRAPARTCDSHTAG